MLKYTKKNNNLDTIDKLILKNISQPTKMPSYIKENIKKTIDYLFLNNTQ